MNLRWPFGDSDGGPASRPLVVDLEGVLVAILADTAAGEAAHASLLEFGLRATHLRLYPSEKILEYDDAFRENRGVVGRVVGAVIDDRAAMAQYVAYARDGRCALWVFVPDRAEADGVVKRLADHPVLHIWYHTKVGMETLHMG